MTPAHTTHENKMATGKTNVRPSECDKNKLEKALRLAIKITAADFASLPANPAAGVRTIVQL